MKTGCVGLIACLSVLVYTLVLRASCQIHHHHGRLEKVSYVAVSTRILPVYTEQLHAPGVFSTVHASACLAVPPSYRVWYFEPLTFDE